MTGFALNVYLAQVLYPAPEQKAELALAFTVLNLGFTIPFVFGGPLAGAWADRHDRKQIMIVTTPGVRDPDLSDFDQLCSRSSAPYVGCLTFGRRAPRRRGRNVPPRPKKCRRNDLPSRLSARLATVRDRPAPTFRYPLPIAEGRGRPFLPSYPSRASTRCTCVSKAARLAMPLARSRSECRVH